MAVTAEQVKELRQATGAGILDCRKALDEHGGDFDKAVDFLREKGLAAAAKRMDRQAKEGMVTAYIHPGSRIGVLIEVNCETDFVARTDEFQGLVRDIAMQIAALGARYLTREAVPAAVVEHEREIFRAQALEEGKPEQVLDKIIDGRVEKFYKEACLMEQPFIRDDKVTMEELVKAAISKTGENIVVRRFARYELGESLEG